MFLFGFFLSSPAPTLFSNQCGKSVTCVIFSVLSGTCQNDNVKDVRYGNERLRMFFWDFFCRLYTKEREKTYDRFFVVSYCQQKYKGRVISLSIFLVSRSHIIFTLVELIFYPVPHFPTSSSHAGKLRLLQLTKMAEWGPPTSTQLGQRVANGIHVDQIADKNGISWRSSADSEMESHGGKSKLLAIFMHLSCASTHRSCFFFVLQMCNPRWKNRSKGLTRSFLVVPPVPPKVLCADA